jgi:hypothetical protein
VTKPIVVHDFTITWGLPFRLPFTWEHADGSPVDISDYTARAESRPAAGDSHLIVAFDTAPGDGEGLIELGGPAGTITLTLAEEQGWTVRRAGVYDLFLYPPDGGVPVKFAAGAQSIDTSVTRPRVTV